MRFVVLPLLTLVLASTVVADIAPNGYGKPAALPNAADLPPRPAPEPTDDDTANDENVKIVGAIALVIGVYVATRLLRKNAKSE